MNISVCMATYNGDCFVAEQIRSILSQLEEHDELIIVDDCSTDNTVNIIKKMKDKHIRLYINSTNRGVNYTFGRAMGYANGDIVLISDQDDIWLKNKISEMKQIFMDDMVDVVCHDAIVVDASGNEILSSKMDGLIFKDNNWIKNIVQNKFMGCCMAFRREITRYPIPKKWIYYDFWIGEIALLKKANVVYSPEKLIKHVLHGNNETGMRRCTVSILISRIKNIICFIYFYIKYHRKLS